MWVCVADLMPRVTRNLASFYTLSLYDGWSGNHPPQIDWRLKFVDGILSKDIELLESVQKFANKVCTKQWREPYNSLRTSLKLPLLKERRAVLKLSVLYKYLWMAWWSCLLILLLPSPTREGTCVLPTIFICIGRLHTRTVIFILVFLIPYHCGTICLCLCIIVFPGP